MQKEIICCHNTKRDLNARGYKTQGAIPTQSCYPFNRAYPVRKDFCVTGFTLIELLVVVLIIGILSAVALPQYQLVVLKTEYTKLKIYSNTIYQAVLRYHLANGSYPKQTEELDVDLPGQHMWGHYIFLKDGAACYIWYDGNGNGGYVGCNIKNVTYSHSFQQSTARSCNFDVGSNNASLLHKLCKQDTQNPVYEIGGGTGTHVYYSYQD